MPESSIAASLKKAVVERARGRCEYCQAPESYSPSPFALEHILPQARGGLTILENLAHSCQGCNNHKFTRTHGRDPDTGKRVPLYNPRQHRWSDHFIWSQDSTRMIGLTPTGRATIVLLQLNRLGLINLRGILHELGKHPPEDRA
jgi:5-methylcytosine-specific restriction endonuclease McrA